MRSRQVLSSTVDLLIEALDFAVHLIHALEGDTASGDFLLCNTALELLIKFLDLVEDLVASSLSGSLLLANFAELSDEFLSTLSRWRVLTLGLCNVQLGSDGVLSNW
jgi:hypothetical protein